MSLTYDEIQTRIKSLVAQKSRAEGQIQAIKESWKSKYNITSLQDAIELQAKLIKELDDAKIKQDNYLRVADELLSSVGV